MLSVTLKVPARRAALLGIAALVALGATPARATVVARGTFADSGTESIAADDFCGIAVVDDFTVSGSFRIRVDKASAGQAFLQRLNLDTADVFTNPLNGKSMSITDSELINELAATPVAGQPNVFEFTTIEAGQPQVVRDAAGNVVLRDRGVIRHHILFDTLGDGAPGGNTLADEIVAVGGPHPGLDPTAFCATVTALIG